MSTIKPGVLCVVRNTAFNNDKIVTVIAPYKAGDVISSPYVPEGMKARYSGWIVEGDIIMVSDHHATPRSYPQGVLSSDQLRPLGGDDLGITEEDVKELYQPNPTKEKVS